MPLGLDIGGHVYVDDWLWLLAAQFGLVQAPLVVMNCVGLGVPLRWHKLALGQTVNGLGLILKLRVPAWLLPSSNMIRINIFLDFISSTMASAKSPVMDREIMESGTGLLMWAAEYMRELRPWLAAFYHALSAPVATLCSVSAAGWSELVESISETW